MELHDLGIEDEETVERVSIYIAIYCEEGQHYKNVCYYSGLFIVGHEFVCSIDKIQWVYPLINYDDIFHGSRRAS